MPKKNEKRGLKMTAHAFPYSESSIVILAKQTGCFATGCKFNIESTDPTTSQAGVLRAGVLLPVSAIKRRTNSSHPL
jgi:hypothetical protein